MNGLFEMVQPRSKRIADQCIEKSRMSDKKTDIIMKADLIDFLVQ